MLPQSYLNKTSATPFSDKDSKLLSGQSETLLTLGMDGSSFPVISLDLIVKLLSGLLVVIMELLAAVTISSQLLCTKISIDFFNPVHGCKCSSCVSNKVDLFIKGHNTFCSDKNFTSFCAEIVPLHLSWSALIFLMRLLYLKTELWGDGCVITLNCACLE